MVNSMAMISDGYKMSTNVGMKCDNINRVGIWR